jgi:CDP-diacylglycerol--serine O-phosphatidyltransferase
MLNLGAIASHICTFLNLLFGFLSILSSLNSGFLTAAWLIVLSAIFDFLDGLLARFSGRIAEFGKEFDSLTDVVSFGVAPSILVYQFYLRKFGALGILLCITFLLFGILRLARYNIEFDGNKKFFKGLSISSSGATVASYIIMLFGFNLQSSEVAQVLLVPLVIVLSFLMISRIKYENVPEFNLSGFRKAPVKFIFVYLGFPLALLCWGKLLFPWFLIYIVKGLMDEILRKTGFFIVR